MAKRFTRNITDTVLTGKEQEPLYTNVQNDLLSDDSHVYVRNKNYYHCLTNAIQDIESKNDNLIIEREDNKVILEVIGGGGSEPIPLDLKMESISKYLDIEKKSDQHFIFSTEQLEIEIANIYKKIEEMGSNEDDFLGNFHDYDFISIRNNDKIQNEKITRLSSYFYAKRIEQDVGKLITEIDSGYEFDKIQLEEFKLDNIEDTARKNIVMSFINNTSKNINVQFSRNFFPGGTPRYENELSYKDNDYQLKANGITDIKFTFYTDPESKVLRNYIKLLS